MTITYVCDNGLYVNTTNRCTNSCDFCVRNGNGEDLYGDLWLEREPTVEEINNAIDAALDCGEKYKEIVFCGFGEPSERLYDIFEVCRHIRSRSTLPIRMNTNGHADLIWGHDTAPDFKGLFDTVSISLNTPNAEEYDRICHCVYGTEGFLALLRFAENVKKYVPSVLLSVVRGSIPDSELERCQKLADDIGVKLRVREML